MFLVTGGAGFVGSHLVEKLVRRGARVRVLDNLTTGVRDNLAAIRDDVEVIDGDVRDEAAVRRAVDGVDVIFHQAADVSVPGSIAAPRQTYDVNVGGTLNLLLAARDAGCRRVVYASSSAVYGDGPENPKRESMLPAPISPYAASKVAGEHLCAVWSHAYGLETVALRYFNVYGPRQDPASPYAAVIPRFISALQHGDQPVIDGDGEQTRDFVFVADVVEANLRAAEAARADGSAFNVATGRSVTLNTVLAEIGALLGADVRPIYREARPGDVRHSAADVTAARLELGFVARVALGAGLATTLAHGEVTR